MIDQVPLRLPGNVLGFFVQKAFNSVLDGAFSAVRNLLRDLAPAVTKTLEFA
jgi:hypothetical protein